MKLKLYLRCSGFNMDYNRNECQAVTENTEDNLFNLRPSTGIAFFEAICLRGTIYLSIYLFIYIFIYIFNSIPPLALPSSKLSASEALSICLSIFISKIYSSTYMYIYLYLSIYYVSLIITKEWFDLF